MNTLNPRFTNSRIRSLQENGIDLFNLNGDEFSAYEKRVQVTIAACAEMSPEVVRAICDDMTPGEHSDLLILAMKRDMTPPSQKEAATTAGADKSQP